MPELSHSPSLKTYLWVYLALLALLAISLGLAFIDFGPMNIFIGVGIGALKALLIMAFFMHLHGGRATTILAALSGIAWLLIFYILVFADYVSRPWLVLPGK